MIKVKKALISVSDKKGLIPFAKGLQSLGVEIISTGGTASQLRTAGINVTEVSDYTKFPEILDGRVKTLHPKIHGGLLALRDKKEHIDQIDKHNIDLIDMVVVNLYPFESVINKKNFSMAEAIENIDIGGPSMIRSAAKNFKNVAVICNPDRYKNILDELEVNSGLLADSVLYNLAVEAFKHTARYDSVIAEFFNSQLQNKEFTKLPKDVLLKFSKVQDLRYGENPHQEAAFYKDSDKSSGLGKIKQLHGKELSFNNILDLNAAIDFVIDFDEPAAVVIKHNNPTGIAQNKIISKAYHEAWSCDPMSAFGGIIGINKKVDVETAKLILKSGFMECVIASGFEQQALKVLKAKKNLRLIEFNFASEKNEGYDFKKVCGGLLLQEKDKRKISVGDLRVVTKKKPTKQQLESAFFGWQAIKNVKSNAIILVKGKKTVGVGCGQTSRVESVNIAIKKAGKNAKGSILISDGFLPKIDNVQLASKAGISLIVQPGGSISDTDVINKTDKAKIAMVFTGVRHFKH